MCLWWRYAGSVLGLVIEIGTTRKNFFTRELTMRMKFLRFLASYLANEIKDEYLRICLDSI
jgi:hypothetical protein